MKVVDFAEMLRDSMEEKINECRGDIHESHNPVYNESLMIKIQALEWVQGRIQDLVINNGRKGSKIQIDFFFIYLFIINQLSMLC
jgi:hypothetical protein